MHPLCLGGFTDIKMPLLTVSPACSSQPAPRWLPSLISVNHVGRGGRFPRCAPAPPDAHRPAGAECGRRTSGCSWTSAKVGLVVSTLRQDSCAGRGPGGLKGISSSLVAPHLMA